MIARFNLLARCALAFLLLLSLFSGMNAHAQVTRAGIITQPDALRPPPPPDEDPPYNYAGFASQSVPTTMTSGAVYTVTVRMRNSGTTTWTSAGAYALGSRNPYDNGTWGGGRVGLAGSVPPGQTATFTFNVTAPASPGSYNFQWAMVQDGVEWFGPPSDNVVVNVVAAAQNGSQFVTQSVPASMVTGQTYSVSVTMQNTGSTTWTAGELYRLVSSNPPGNATWTVTRVELPASVAPGQSATFNFQVVAPATPGTYNYQWMMLREGVELFGATSPNIGVVVSAPAFVNGAAFAGQSVPATMAPGQTYNVSVAMQNTGSTTWTAGELYRLVSSNPPGNATWTVTRVELTGNVAPGQTATFNFQVIAPAASGPYSFQWMMLREGVELFGATSPNVMVQVSSQGDTVTYIHTDALGSPVARSDSAGNVISRTSYEPYGRTASGVEPTIGFTGHVNDADTGLVYMQQRYYDPVAGRFLSVDPVVTDASTGSSFNRYSYSRNSPFRYVDPDGRDGRDNQIQEQLAQETKKCPFCGGVTAAGSVVAGGTRGPKGAAAAAIATVIVGIANSTSQTSDDSDNESGRMYITYVKRGPGRAILHWPRVWIRNR